MESAFDVQLRTLTGSTFDLDESARLSLRRTRSRSRASDPETESFDNSENDLGAVMEWIVLNALL